ncbi:MAG: SRPBCC family protein [Acidimicrobiia bacterium]
MESAGGSQVRIERVLHASIHEVFDAWTDPATMAMWLSPVGHAEAEVDLRVMGRFKVSMIGETTRIEHTGEYLVVNRPNELSFTWQSLYTGSEASVVTVLFEAEGDETRIVLTHHRLPEGQVDPHTQGWEAMITRLAGLLDRMRTES